eukprot:TRINITY_DN2101_c0_g2_i5.p1 TRINITY_DN2101_c0_g2~~TRINITY_DN2101_c0_g2_i5.p1  ORF type:complete len:228 (+),score=24.39 TRINITY_DN2101_c0_g2_i5:144-827(+)
MGKQINKKSLLNLMSGYEDEFGEVSYQFTKKQNLFQLVLVVGDFHIPSRATAIPECFTELLVNFTINQSPQAPNKVQNVICTGNIGNRETIDWLKTLSGNFQTVLGDCDEIDQAPEYSIFKIGSFKFCVIHGHQIIPWGDTEALGNFSREFDVDVVIYGNTHEQKITKFDNKYFLNPGSTTGAYSSLKTESIPSFLLLEIKDQIGVYLYQCIQGQIKIDKTVLTFNK